MSNSTLGHLLEIEAEAAALVNEAQEEADRRIHENEEKNRADFDRQLKEKIKLRELSLEEEKEKINIQYQKELDDFRREMSGVNADETRFFSLLNEYLTQARFKTGL